MGDLADTAQLAAIDDIAGKLDGTKICQSAQPQSPVHQAEPGSPNHQSSEKPPTIQDQFRAFARFGDCKSDGRTIALSQSDKWMKQSHVIDGKKITTTDSGIYFKRFKLQRIVFTDYLKFLEELAKAKKVDLDDIKNKLINCGCPGLVGTTSAAKSSAVDRLTNSAQYTGSHKQRFDSAGKGRGIDGRKDLPDGSGYVSGFKGKDTPQK